MTRFLENAAFSGPAWLEQALLPPLSAVGLPKLAGVAHITLAACLASFALQKASAFLSPRLFPKTYPTIRAKRDDWDLHVVGWAYALVATPLALSMIWNPSKEIVADRLYGYGVAEGRLSAFAVGYFIWDAFVSAKHIKTQGLGFFLHGAGCGTAFLFTLKPFLMWCGPNFLIWELSTIFLNAHWYLDKFGLTGSTLQLVNGVFLLSTYVGARLVWGTYNSYQLMQLLFFSLEGQAAPRNVRVLYLGLNCLMNSLNFFWFRAMVLALRKRFVKGGAARGEKIDTSGKLGWGKEGGKKEL